MQTEERNHCPTCGSSTLAEAVGGHCPGCLLKLASTLDEHEESARSQLGNYKLGRQIGAGGMGVVYEAYRLSDNRRVALKLMRDAHLASPIQMRRFTIEAEAAMRLDHPNIVRIHEIGEEDGPPFLCMDLIDGESLSVKLARGEMGGRLGGPTFEPIHTQAQIAGLMAKIARAVHHAHDRGVLHRDLKPANILIDSAGEPHLTDFGLARLLQTRSDEGEALDLTASGDLPGTPSYMAPEQVARTPVGPATDVYGLGAVLYVLLTGTPPFRGPTPLDLFRQIMDTPPVAPRTLHPGLHPDLETICQKCLEKDPCHRYVSGRALADDLCNFANGRPIEARKASYARRTRVWIKRNPVGAALMVSLCLGLSVALTLLKIVNDQRQAIQLDRDLSFDDGMQRISLIWSDPDTRSVSISARELAIMAGKSSADLAQARRQLTMGISADDGPSSMAQRYARFLNGFQAQVSQNLGEQVAFNLRLFKRFNQDADTLARGEVDLMVLSAVEFLHAERTTSGVASLALDKTVREGVICARTNSAFHHLAEVRGHAIAFPDPKLSLTVSAKARLGAVDLRASDLFPRTFLDQTDGRTVLSTSATIESLVRGEVDAAVTHRAQFERYRHLGLVCLDQFPEPPQILAARAGLDSRVLDALQAVLRAPRQVGWQEDRFAAEALEEPGPSPLSLFRQQLIHAERFEQSPVAGSLEASGDTVQR